MVEGMPEAFCANLAVIVGQCIGVVRALEKMSCCWNRRIVNCTMFIQSLFHRLKPFKTLNISKSCCRYRRIGTRYIEYLVLPVLTMAHSNSKWFSFFIWLLLVPL